MRINREVFMELRYIELKSGYSDNGPAWIGFVKLSRTGTTVYFNDKAFRRYRGISGNYIDIESGEEYWISGVKKDGTDRVHGASGKIVIAENAVDEYLRYINKGKLDLSRLVVRKIDNIFPVERINRLLTS